MSNPLETALILNGSMLIGCLIAWAFVQERPRLPTWWVLLWLLAFAWGWLA